MSDYEIGYKKPPAGWPRGVSGNPSGTVAGTPKVKQALMRLLRLSPERTFEVKTRGDQVAAELVRLALKSRDPRVRLSAIVEILNRLYGRPAQELAITGEQRTRIVVELGLVRDVDADRADYRIEALDGDRAAAGLLGE